MDQRLATLRKEYGRSELSTDTVQADPMEQFADWLRAANEAGIAEPNAMTLCTATSAGHPSARVVLLKGFGPDGFTFFTNYQSRKAQDLADNPRAALVFWWRELERQVCIEGNVSRVSESESDEYFRLRPLGSRLGAWASPQSRVIASRDELEERVREVQSRYKEDVPRPEYWGGYRLAPNSVEFWQGRPDRLHDRIRYSLVGGEWVIERLAP